ncbi:MAG TPA: hypothetical protein VJ792_05415 [Candidatus Nitrosotalea sp.]|nr:hypothetical protein [Candidatus Nitrosotalea sp.]
MSKNWRPPSFLLSQLLHFFVGTTFVFAAVDLHFPWYDGAIAILIVSGIKEVTFDRWIEGDSYRDGLIDWLFYGAGCLIAYVIMLFF